MEFFQFMEGPMQQPYIIEPQLLVETEAARVLESERHDWLLDEPMIDEQQFGPIPTNVDFAG